MNRGEIRDRVYSILTIDTDRVPTADVDTAINEAVRRLAASLPAPWDTVTDAMVTIASTNTYAVSDLTWTLRRPIRLGFLRSDGIEQEITMQDLISFRRAYPSTLTESYPLHFTIWAESFILGPTPDAAYTITVDYLRKPDDLTTDASSNGWTQQLADLVARYAAQVVARDIDEHEVADRMMGVINSSMIDVRIEFDQLGYGIPALTQISG